MIAAKVGKKLCCCQMATQQVALKSEEKTQSLLDNAPNYLVGCVIQKRSMNCSF